MIRAVAMAAWWALLSVVAGVSLAVVIGWMAREAKAHDPYTGWTVPGTMISCCNRQDCRPIPRPDTCGQDV